MIEAIYWYCTDFCVNMANFLSMSYVEFNIWLFIILIPGITAFLLLLNVWRYLLTPMLKSRH